MTEPKPQNSPPKEIAAEVPAQEEQLPFLDDEALQNLANSYKELNEQQNQEENNPGDFIGFDETIKNQNEVEREEISDEQSNREHLPSDNEQPEFDLEQIQQQNNQKVQNQPIKGQPQQQPQPSAETWQQEKAPQLQRACCRSCIKKIRGKTCVCVVPASLRKQDISEKGCRTCGCKGCGDEANIKPELQREKKEYQQIQQQQHNYQPKQQQEQKKEVLQNGCCRECMKAFSKTGKSCLCQVPKAVRKFELPANGCNICGCKGCNPGDLRKQQEKPLKRSYSRSHSHSYSNRRRYSKHRRSPSYSRSRSGGRRGSRYYHSRSRSHRKSPVGGHYRSSIDQPSQFGNKPSQQQQESLNFESMNFQNFQNSVFGQYVQKTLSIFPPLMGFGIPERTPSYILGKPIENNE